MSGGHFDYNQWQLNEWADEIEHVIRTNDSDEPDEWGGVKGYHFNKETLEKFQVIADTLNMAREMVQRVDWLLSDDDGEDAFHKRWEEEVAPWIPKVVKGLKSVQK